MAINHLQTMKGLYHALCMERKIYSTFLGISVMQPEICPPDKLSSSGAAFTGDICGMSEGFVVELLSYFNHPVGA